MFGHSSGSIKQIVFVVPFIEPRAFGIGVFIFHIFHPFLRIGCTKALNGLFDFTDFTFQGNHVVIEFRVIDVRISPIQVGLSVIVNEYSRIDVVPTSVVKRFADGIFKWAER